MKDEIILIGGGGHCKSCIDVIEQQNKYKIIGIVDVPNRRNQTVLGYNIFATDTDIPMLVDKKRVLITIGQIKSPEKRIQLYKMVKTSGANLPAIISPLAYISPHSKIGEGTIIMHHAIINAGVTIGKNCIINTKSLIEHDSIVGDHCHISTSAVLNGGVRVGNGSFIGSGAICKERSIIGEHSVIRMRSNTRFF